MPKSDRRVLHSSGYILFVLLFAEISYSVNVLRCFIITRVTRLLTAMN